MAILIEIPAPAARDVSKAVRFARNSRRVVLFGVSGPEAAAAIRRYLRARWVATIILRCKGKITAHEILRRLVRQLKLMPTRPGSRISGTTLYELLEKQLAGGRTLLVLDGAHTLTDSAFGLLRDFYNDWRLPVLLLADEGFARLVQRRMFKHLTWRSTRYPLEKGDLSWGKAHGQEKR